MSLTFFSFGRRQRTLFVLAVLVLAIGAPGPSARAYAADCPSFEEPKINVQPIYTTPHYNDTLGLKELRIMSGQPDSTYAGLHNLPVGLTASSLRIDSSFEVTIRTTSQDPMACAQISRFDLEFGFDDTTVYLARELPFHSCGYETVLEHESRHVAADQYLLASYLPQLPALLADTIRRAGVIRAASPETAEEHLNNVMRNYLRDMSASIASVRDKLQRQIDSPEEYKRISRSCNGEIAHVLGYEPLPPDPVTVIE